MHTAILRQAQDTKKNGSIISGSLCPGHSRATARLLFGNLPFG